MSASFPERDLKSLWQKLEVEETTMSIQELNLRARMLMKRGRRDALARALFGAIAGLFCGIVLLSTRTNVALIAGLVMVMLLVDAARNVYAFYRRSGDAAGAVWSSCLEAYRADLERQQIVATQPAWHFPAALLVIAWLSRRTYYTGHDSLAVVLPVVLVAAAAFIVWMGVRKVQARHLQMDIDALDRFEQDNPS